MGEPRFSILRRDMGGWLRVYLGEGEPTGEVAQFLSHSLTEWMRERSDLRVRFVVPINRDGDTAELHAWYDQIRFPDTSPMAASGQTDRRLWRTTVFHQGVNHFLCACCRHTFVLCTVECPRRQMLEAFSPVLLNQTTPIPVTGSPMMTGNEPEWAVKLYA